MAFAREYFLHGNYTVRNFCIKLPLHVMEIFFSNVHGEKWRSGEYERLLRIKNDYYKREESI